MKRMWFVGWSGIRYTYKRTKLCLIFYYSTNGDRVLREG